MEQIKLLCPKEGLKVLEWVPVTERLPELMNPVQIFESNKSEHFRFKTGFFDRLNRVWNIYFDDDESAGYYHSPYVTHWMPLPPAP